MSSSGWGTIVSTNAHLLHRLEVDPDVTHRWQGTVRDVLSATGSRTGRQEPAANKIQTPIIRQVGQTGGN